MPQFALFVNKSLLCTNFKTDNESTGNQKQVLSPFGCFSPGNGRLLLFSPKTIF
jgi:hypothetical protein